MGGVRWVFHSECSDVERGGFALGNWHFVLAWKVHFVVFLLFFSFCFSLFFSLRKEQRLQPGLAA